MEDNVLLEFVAVGSCPVNIDECVKQWSDKNSSISQWHDEYKLVDLNADKSMFKCVISKQDALTLIGKLDLELHRSDVFKNAFTWKSKKP